MSDRVAPRPALPVLTLALGVGLFVLIRQVGSHLAAPVAVLPSPAVAAPHGSTARQFLIALTAILIAARALSWVMRRIHQPPVIGEMVAGIMLGPSLLGRVAPSAMEWIFPRSVEPALAMFSQVGVILYMFLVGLDLDLDALRGRRKAAAAISYGSILLPFLLGAALSLVLYPRLGVQGGSFTVFALFIACSMAVTAFPVLARILTDRNIATTDVGRMALTCAAINDVAAWCLFAFIVAIAESNISSGFATLFLTGLYTAVMFFVARPLILRLIRRYGVERPLTQGALGTICVGLLLSALGTEAIGIHAIFGAFLLGAIIPSRTALAIDIARRLEELVVVLFLPAFFAFTGLRAQLGLVSGAGNWELCGLILLVACAGKFFGAALVARATGDSWRRASALGVLMNTRGLMELIVLNIGLELGIISPTLFAMLVIMAVAATAATAPLVDLLLGADAATQSELAADARPSVR